MQEMISLTHVACFYRAQEESHETVYKNSDRHRLFGKL